MEPRKERNSRKGNSKRVPLANYTESVVLLSPGSSRSGVICVTLTPAGLAFKLPDRRCAKLIDSGVATHLKYFAKSPIKKGYALFTDLEQLSKRDAAKYFQEAVTYAISTNVE